VTIRRREEGHQLRVPLSEQDWVRGPADAPVTLVEYGDYECPACQYAHGEVEKLLEAEGHNVRFVFRHFPLMTTHPQAMAAALAVEAAGRQGKFWEMHHKLFESRGQLDHEHIRGYAAELGLELDNFARDIKSKEIEVQIRQHRLEGARSGVNGTPTFFVNGSRYDGDITYEALSSAVQTAINGEHHGDRVAKRE